MAKLQTLTNRHETKHHTPIPEVFLLVPLQQDQITTLQKLFIS